MNKHGLYDNKVEAYQADFCLVHNIPRGIIGRNHA